MAESTAAATGELLAAIEVASQRWDLEVAGLKDQLLEFKYHRSPERFLPMKRLRRIRVVAAHQLEMLEAAEEQGLITSAEFNAVGFADIIVRGREGAGDAAHDALVVVEVSWTVRRGDVTRAARRADTLRKAGYVAYGAVAGRAIGIQDRDLATANGGEVYIQAEDSGD